MSFTSTFTRSIIREVGRNFGKAISNQLLGDAHSTPIRVTRQGGKNTTHNYNNNLDKLCKTWMIKGATANFNVGQNIHKLFFDLVEEAQNDGKTTLKEIHQLCHNYIQAKTELFKLIKSLNLVGRDDLASKLIELDKEMSLFFSEFNSEFKVPTKPNSVFSNKEEREYYHYAITVKKLLNNWDKTFNNSST
jgi:hypothetical protein